LSDYFSGGVALRYIYTDLSGGYGQRLSEKAASFFIELLTDKTEY
jgi:hypothetical protein